MNINPIKEKASKCLNSKSEWLNELFESRNVKQEIYFSQNLPINDRNFQQPDLQFHFINVFVDFQY